MSSQAHPVTTSPFHPGERAIQQQAMVSEEADTRGRHMLNAESNIQQRQFFQQQPFVVTAHCDQQGQPWAGLITGTAGFIQLDESRQQAFINYSDSRSLTGLDSKTGSSIGLLTINFSSRRRNRLNATVLGHDEQQCRLLIDQIYGNCPKFIPRREWPAKLFEQAYASQTHTTLNPAMVKLVNSTETFFIASSSGPPIANSNTQANAWGADISHRGGEAGFLSYDQASNRLTFADYSGNNLFNTLGNLHQHPFCGLLLIDFSSGALLQIAGKARLTQHMAQRSTHIDIVSVRHWLPDLQPSPSQDPNT
jgi:predicted pyridoxine 5'-phosphate oxidase superfamily flavin-nucleotide-binding protein